MFDAGCCVALGKSYITLHDQSLVHALKEVDGAAQAWTQTPDQVDSLHGYQLQLYAIRESNIPRFPVMTVGNLIFTGTNSG
ncbi:YtoQ family protein [Microbulbifer sp. PSTR4-B]|uniref:YtoQ family protein n=1 Tax=Microbulbifer sp. PSTR4-B TaxID=3243396 RepID=UPI004039ADF4